MRDGRWVTVTDSEFQHERRGLEAIQDRLRDNDPWRAWSNFTFTAATGHVREVDLLVIAPGGVHLIELKDWHGSVESRNGTWLQTQPGGRQISHGNPLHLANKKAKELAWLLKQHGEPVWVSEAVCFTDSSLRNRLPAHDQHGVHTVHQLIQMLEEPPRDERRRIDGPRSRRIAAALERIGIARSDAAYKVGPYLLHRKSFDSGPTWADYLAQHSELPEAARIRVYLRERGSDTEMRASVERAARREAAVLRRFRHPGVVQLKQYDPTGHSAGPALIFDYDPRTLRLDDYLIQYGEKLDVLSRIALVRQLAETVRSAHGRRLYHRTLSAHAIHVMPRGRGSGKDGDEAGWLTPHLQISDWQVAVQRGPEQGGASGGERFAPTTFSRAGAHLAESADPYLAPELTAPRADPVALDVYGLGVLTYLLATGKAPAASQAELMARYEAGEGLRPSAVVDGLSEYIDELVQAATAYDVPARLSSVDDFLEMLEVVEETLTAPSPTSQPLRPAGPAPEKDPLEAVAGDVLAGRWEVRRRLGTGSTSRAFLVRDLTAGPEVRFAKSLAVLKVAVSERSGEILRREAEVMGRLRADSRIIRLIEPEPQSIGGRTVLVMEYVGDEREADGTPAEPGATRTRRREETVARQLRDSGRLSVDQLEAYGDYLFGAVDFLEGEGVWHRDIKPDNIAIRIRPNRTRELVLIDFSLAGYPVKETEAGTDGYLDPFIGTLTDRSVYDAHAERYALAVTLHEMASRELPVWGGGKVSPRQTKPEKEPYPAIAADAFDPAVKDGLVEFFRKALHRDAAQRFKDLKPMRDAWKKIFLAMDEAKPSSKRSRRQDERTSVGSADAAIAVAEEETAEEQRDRLAASVDRATPISASGLSPAAESFVYGLRVDTVGQLLDHSQRTLVNAPGLGAKTRKEVLGRIKQWRRLLAEQPAAPLTPEGRKAAKEELSAAEAAVALAVAQTGAGGDSERALRTVSLDALATVFVPELKKDGSNRNECEMVRLLLRLPDEQGVLPEIGVWPMQKDVAEALRLSAAQVSLMLKTQRGRWKRHAAVRTLRAEILELLRDLGRVASAAEIADALAVRRGTELQEREQRRALALAAVRAVVEVEQLVPDEATFQHAPNRDASDEAMGAGLLALEVSDDDAPETPSAPGLLDYAQRLGRVADRLAKLDTLPTSTTVLGELSAVTPPSTVVEWDERRTVELAAAASRNAAATPRLEIYPRDLPLVRALRLTQAGLVRLIPGLARDLQPGLTAEDIHERVRARFPELLDERGGHSLPKDGRLTKALKAAGFDLELSTRAGTPRISRYLPRQTKDDSSFLSLGNLRKPTAFLSEHRYADDVQLAGAVTAEERLLASAPRDGFRVLTVRTGLATEAVEEVTGSRFGAEPVSVTELFLDALHELVDRRPKPTWETILRADVAEPGSKAAMKFAEYAGTAWGAVEPRLGELLTGGARVPLFLTDAGALARYDAMGVLNRLAERSRGGGRGLWLLCPQDDPARPPRLGTVAVPYQAGLGEWVVLPDAWVENAHRSGGQRRDGFGTTSTTDTTSPMGTTGNWGDEAK
ncbi:BREX system serine/threonine kinase PglW [Streptomyces sp. R302]|uniref:BREX system serine/threonine kinase PglW n=1 Tax=unclassified Streptomyces TaxID=2593676 RepID=UPI00145D6234|nr:MULTISPECIES: BREX system serine/threonine kinase PglW [unclassified Streptomyces]NML54292.1 BREX system serine/threonine kinase PglW [Streptomyces sp. R301]NML78466.1 BREX system serine/threonine kinase PglW [Streptomyces sp. R302]